MKFKNLILIFGIFLLIVSPLGVPQIAEGGGITPLVSAKDFIIRNESDSSDEYFVINGTTGFTGIGTGTPGDTLDVHGGITTTSGFTSDAVGSIGWTMKRGGVNYGVWNTDGNDVRLALQNSAELGITGGNVGIGTTTPQNPLNVIGVGNFTGNVYLQNILSSMSGYDLKLTSGDANGNIILDAVGDGTLRFRNDGGDQMRIDKDGNVGIGTTTPGGLFHVNGTSPTIVFNGSAGQINFRLGNPTRSWLIISDDSPDGLRFKDEGAGADSFFLQGATGNIGIGTTTPMNKLNVIGDINATANVSTPKFCLGADCIETWGAAVGAEGGWNDTGTIVELVTSTNDVNATTMYINNTAGRVGIGTNSPGYKLDVDGDIALNKTATNRLILPLSNDATTPTISFGDGDTGFYEAADDNLRIATGGNVRWVINSAGDIEGVNTGRPQIMNADTSSTIPGYAFLGDTNTGIGRAAANQLSLIAGGSEIMRLTNSSSTVDFNGGWASGGASVVDGDVYAQTVYVYNITSLSVSNLNINGSLLPQADYDNIFDVGSPTLRWNEAYFGGNINTNSSLCLSGDCQSSWDSVVGSEGGWNDTGTVVGLVTSSDDVDANTLYINNTSGRVGIGTTTPENQLDVKSATPKIQLSDTTGGAKDAILQSDESIFSIGTSSVPTMFNLNLTSENVGIGTTSPDGILNTAESTGVLASDVLFDTYSETNGASTTLSLRKSASATIGTKTETADGESLGLFRFQGVDSGSNYDYGAVITGVQDGASGTYVPTKMKLYTFSDSGSNDPQLILASDGNVGIGTTSPDEKLEIAGAGTQRLQVTETSTPVETQLKATTSTGYVGTSTAHPFVIQAGNSDKMTILTSGNVGIGTTSPYALLHVADTNVEDVPNGDILMTRYYSTGPTSVRGSAIFHYSNSSLNQEGLYFGVAGDGGSNDAPNQASQAKMVILASGKAGINTTTPQNTLNVIGDGNFTGNLYSNGLLVGSGTLNSSAWNSTGDKVFLANTSALVGIGTTSPDSLLHIKGNDTELRIERDTSGNATLNLYNADNHNALITYNPGNAFMYIDNNYPGSADYGDIRFRVKANGGALSEAMTIDGLGNVGIGTTSPNTLLHVNSSTTNTAARFQSTDANTYIFFQDNTGTGVMGINGNDIVFKPADVEKMRIDSDGNVGIGTTDPKNTLNVVGTANVTGQCVAEGTLISVVEKQDIEHINGLSVESDGKNYHPNISGHRGDVKNSGGFSDKTREVEKIDNLDNFNNNLGNFDTFGFNHINLSEKKNKAEVISLSEKVASKARHKVLTKLNFNSFNKYINISIDNNNNNNVEDASTLNNSKYKIKKVPVQDVKSGDYVLSLNESSGEIESAKVNALLDMGEKPIYELVTESGKAINTTAEHPYLVKLYSQEECDKYAGDVWNAPAGVPLEGKEFNGEFPRDTQGEHENLQAGDSAEPFCERWISVSGLEEGREIAVQRLEKNYNLSSSLKSSVLSILIEDCFLKPGSFDHIIQSNFNASAKIGTSLSCISCLACDSNILNEVLGTISMNLDKSDKASLNCDELSLEYFNTSDSLFFNSSITYSGVNNLTSNNFELTIINLTGFSLKKDSNMFVSTTNCIFYQPSFLYLFHTPSLILSPSFKQSSSVSLEFSNSLSSLLSNKALLTFSAKNCLTDSDQFISDKESRLCFKSSGMDNVKLGILKSSQSLVYPVEDVQVFKSFDSEKKVGFEKITSINQYAPQHVYDLAVEGTHNFIANDIVAHNTYLENTKCATGEILTTDATTGLISCTTGSGLSGVVNGSGTSGYLARWNGTSSLNNSVVYESSGNVGIGTTSPNALLHVNGSAIINGTLIGLSNATDLTGAVTLSQLQAVNTTANIAETDPHWTGNSTLVPYLASANTFTANNVFNTNLTVDTNTLFVNSNTNNVGIGTTSPGGKLAIGINDFSKDSTALKLDTRTADNSANDRSWNFLVGKLSDTEWGSYSLRIYPQDVGGSVTRDLVISGYDESGGRIRFGFGQPTTEDATTGYTDRMTILNNGNVGIGTTDPNSKLEVAGTFNSTSSGGTLQVDSNGNVKIGI